MIQVIPEMVDVGGRKRIKVTIREGERVIDADLIDPFQAAQRRKAVQRLAERAGEPHAAERIEQALLQCVDLMEAAGKAEEADDAAAAQRETPAGAMSVVRPELIICEGVVAVSVPEVVIRDGEAVGRWRVYLRLPPDQPEEPGLFDARESDQVTAAEKTVPDTVLLPALSPLPVTVTQRRDRRECRPLTPRIDAGQHGGGGALWVHPVPSAPSPSTPAGWSEGARKAWLEDADDVDAVAVFDEVIAALEEYLDVEEQQNKDEGGRMKDESNPPQAGASSPPIHPSSFIIQPSTPHPLLATLALWTMLTYLYVAWDAVPYLFVTGPAGSGKTRVFELLSRLCFRPLLSSNLSAPALFRTLHDRGGTLLLDEAERLTEGGDDVAELRSILLAGYKRGGRASRLESAGDNYQMSEFQVYGPKAIACINTIPPALASRCIPVQMFRSPPGSDKPRQRIDRDPARWQRLRDGLHAALLGPLGKAATELACMADLCPLGGRQYELWQPILALAGWLDCERSKRRQGIARGAEPWSPPLHPRVLEYAHKLCDGGSESLLPEEDFLLLWTLTDSVVRERQANCKSILETARRAGPDALRGVSARGVAEILKRYGLTTERSNGRRIYRTSLDQLRKIESRYNVDLNTAGKVNLSVLKGTWY